VLAAIFTILAISTRIGTDFLETMTAMVNPLPAIALLPLALIWFGLGNGSLVFVLGSIRCCGRWRSTPIPASRASRTRCAMVGRNYGLRGLPYVARILSPAAFGSILTGLKIGWAFAWRNPDRWRSWCSACRRGRAGSAGSSSRTATCWIFPPVFAGLLTVIVIGLVVENLIFRTIERNTVQKWGTQS